MEFVDLGRIAFERAWEIQEDLARRIAEGRENEKVLLLEHPHTFTVGRTGSPENLLASVDWEGNPIRLVRINRGGDVTYHGPGQLVGYPLLNLGSRGRDVHGYLRGLEECLILAASEFGVAARRREKLTGVWTDAGKLASIGVGVRRWVTLHGFALNVACDLRYFRLLNPCGMVDCPMTSLNVETGRAVPLADAAAAVRRSFQEVFSRRPVGKA